MDIMFAKTKREKSITAVNSANFNATICQALGMHY